MMSNEKKPIRVAHIIGKLWAGGVEAVVFNYYRALDKEKVQFDFFYDDDSTVEPPQDLIDMGARFYRIPRYQKLFRYLKTLRRYFKKNKYQIVHSHLNSLSVFPLFVAWKERVPVRIAHNHSVPGGSEIKRNVVKNFLRVFSKVFSTDYFACSENAGKWLFGERTFDQGKVVIVKNAIDFSRFAVPEAERKIYADKYKLTGKFVVSHVGRFTYAKNHSFLIDIFQKITQLKPDAVLMLVGDGELRKKITRGIRKKGLQNRVIMVGKVANPEVFYRLSDVVLLPSVFEGLPVTAIESQISGVPIIISDAVPDEAAISNGCFKMRLADSASEWAKKAIAVSGTEIRCDHRKDVYNIEVAVGKLTKWYLDRIGGIR